MSKIACVHSFRHGTGKSTISANLAVLMASRGYRVGITDTHIQSPGLHVILDLQEQKIGCSLNEYLSGDCAIADSAYDLSELCQKFAAASAAVAGGGGNRASTGKLYLLPSNQKIAEIAKLLRQGYNTDLLGAGFNELIRILKLDYLLIDTNPGLNEETLLVMALADAMLVVLRTDRQDIQGTSVTVDVARKFDIPQVYLAVNQVLSSYDFAAVQKQMEAVYQVPVAGILPFSEEMVELAVTEELFCIRYPQHPVTRVLSAIASRLIECPSREEAIGDRLADVALPPRPQPPTGFSVLDLLANPDSTPALLPWMMRQRLPVTLAETAAQLGTDEVTARTVLEELAERGCVRQLPTKGVPHFEVIYAPKQGRQLSQTIWQLLEDKSGE